MQFSSEEYRVSEESGYVNVALIKTGSNAIDIPVIFNTSDQNATGKYDIGLLKNSIKFVRISTPPQLLMIMDQQKER